MASQRETADQELAYALSTRNDSRSHRILTETELAIFRTQLCEAQCRGSCPDPDRCSDSHCLTWQRRNPLRVFYSPTLCPDIEFVRRNSRMALVRRCTRGRTCPYAHSKEEELYHPMVYKTKLCKVHPHCKRFHCPFAHDSKELRRRMTAEDYFAAKIAAADRPKSWASDSMGHHFRTRSPCSGLTSTLTTEASATGAEKNFLLKSPTSVRILPSNDTTVSCGPKTTSPRSLPNMPATSLPGFRRREGQNCYSASCPVACRGLQEPSSVFSRSADPFEPHPISVDAHQGELLRGLESIIDKLTKLQMQRRASDSENADTTEHSNEQVFPYKNAPLQQPEDMAGCSVNSTTQGEGSNELLWKEIATALVCGTAPPPGLSQNLQELDVCSFLSTRIDQNANPLLAHLIANPTDLDGHEQLLPHSPGLLMSSASPT